MKRRVQHYGYVFDYASATVVDSTNSSATLNCCPPLPAVVPVQDHEGNSNKHNTFHIQSFIEESVTKLRGWDVFAGILGRIRNMELVRGKDGILPEQPSNAI